MTDIENDMDSDLCRSNIATLKDCQDIINNYQLLNLMKLSAKDKQDIGTALDVIDKVIDSLEIQILDNDQPNWRNLD